MALVQPGGLLQDEALADLEAGGQLLPVDLAPAARAGHRPADDFPECLIFGSIPLDLRRVDEVAAWER